MKTLSEGLNPSVVGGSKTWVSRDYAVHQMFYILTWCFLFCTQHSIHTAAPDGQDPTRFSRLTMNLQQSSCLSLLSSRTIGLCHV